MRIKERIPIFLKNVDWDKLLDTLWKMSEKEKMDYLININTQLSVIESTWNENPDWRIIQVLVNIGLIPNALGMWYYKEDIEILIEIGCEPRDVLQWGNNYDKDMNKLSTTKWVLIKDMKTDHIKSILNGKWVKNKLYIDAFNNELKLRNE